MHKNFKHKLKPSNKKYITDYNPFYPPSPSSGAAILRNFLKIECKIFLTKFVLLLTNTYVIFWLCVDETDWSQVGTPLCPRFGFFSWTTLYFRKKTASKYKY